LHQGWGNKFLDLLKEKRKQHTKRKNTHERPQDKTQNKDMSDSSIEKFIKESSSCEYEYRIPRNERANQFTVRAIHNQIPTLNKDVLAVVALYMSWSVVEEYLTKKFSMTKRMYSTEVQNAVESFCCVRSDSSYWYIPLVIGIQTYGLPRVDLRTSGRHMSDDAVFAGKLNDEQSQHCCDIIKGLQIRKESSGMVKKPCGSGKTVVGIKSSIKMKRVTAVLCHKSFLIKQWQDRYSTFAPNARVGIWRQKKTEVEGNDVVLVMIQSLVMCKYSKKTLALLDQVGLVIVDECHHIAAPLFSTVMRYFKAKYRIGLSATPERADGLGKFLFWCMGDFLVNQSPTDQLHSLPSSILVAPLATPLIAPLTAPIAAPIANLPSLHRSARVETIRYDAGKQKIIQNKARVFNRNMMMSMLGLRDHTRTSMVLREIIRIVQENSKRKVIVFGHRNKQLYALEHYCHTIFETGMYTGEQKDDDVLAWATTRRCIFVNWGMAKEALDIPGCNVVIMITPVPHVYQGIGRILGYRANTSEEPYIVDIQDPFAYFINYSDTRLKLYHKLGFHVESRIINNQDVRNVTLDYEVNNKKSYRARILPFLPLKKRKPRAPKESTSKKSTSKKCTEKKSTSKKSSAKKSTVKLIPIESTPKEFLSLSESKALATLVKRPRFF
jgi:superfamily II DNA or RNA helicase